LNDSIIAFLALHLALLLSLAQVAAAGSVALSYVAPWLGPKLEKYPRAHALLLVLPTAFLDFRKLVDVLRQVVTGQLPTLDPKALFDSYNASAGGVNFQGAKTPPWEELPAKIQDNWRAVARHVALRNR
jgi:hypothetical protein